MKEHNPDFEPYYTIEMIISVLRQECPWQYEKWYEKTAEDLYKRMLEEQRNDLANLL